MARDLPFVFIYLVAESNRIHDGELQVDVALLQVVGARPQANGALIVAGFLRLERGVEKSVHQRGLPNARLAWGGEVISSRLLRGGLITEQNQVTLGKVATSCW